MEQPQIAKKWYDDKTAVILLCFFFWPMGLYGIWKNRQIRKRWKFLYTGLVTFIFLVLFSAIGSIPKSESNNTVSQNGSPSERKTVRVMKAAELHTEYHENEVLADKKYKGKRLYITGIISAIEKDFMDNIIVRFSTTNQFMSMSCYLDDEDVASQLVKGEQVVLKCKCDGLSLGSVVMKDCEYIGK